MHFVFVRGDLLSEIHVPIQCDQIRVARPVRRSDLDRTLRIHPFGRAIRSQIHSRRARAAMLVPLCSAGKVPRLHHMHLRQFPIVDGARGMHHGRTVLHLGRQHNLRLKDQLPGFRVVLCPQCLTRGFRVLKIHFTIARGLAGFLMEDQSVRCDVNDLRIPIRRGSRMRGRRSMQHDVRFSLRNHNLIVLVVLKVFSGNRVCLVILSVVHVNFNVVQQHPPTGFETDGAGRMQRKQLPAFVRFDSTKLCVVC